MDRYFFVNFLWLKMAVLHDKIVSNILNCQTDISINTAARLGIALDTGYEYWVNLQASYNKTREDDNTSLKAARKVSALK